MFIIYWTPVPSAGAKGQAGFTGFTGYFIFIFITFLMKVMKNNPPQYDLPDLRGKPGAENIGGGRW